MPAARRGVCPSSRAPYLDVLLQDDVEGWEEVLLQLSHLADVGSCRESDEGCDALKEVVVEAGLRGVLAHLEKHRSEPLQAHGGYTSDLQGTAGLSKHRIYKA